MIEICEQFSENCKLQFNPNKCTLFIFSDSDYYFNNVCIKLCGRVIKNVRSETHLGSTIDYSYVKSYVIYQPVLITVWLSFVEIR